MSRHRRRRPGDSCGISEDETKTGTLFVVDRTAYYGNHCTTWSIQQSSAASSIRREFLHSRIPKVRHFLIKGEIFMTGTEPVLATSEKYII